MIVVETKGQPSQEPQSHHFCPATARPIKKGLSPQCLKAPVKGWVQCPSLNRGQEAKSLRNLRHYSVSIIRRFFMLIAKNSPVSCTAYTLQRL